VLRNVTPHNNAFGAYARFARSGVHGAYDAHDEARGWTRSGGAWLVDIRAWRRVANL
jgi:hypothetical protein